MRDNPGRMLSLIILLLLPIWGWDQIHADNTSQQIDELRHGLRMAQGDMFNGYRDRAIASLTTLGEKLETLRKTAPNLRKQLTNRPSCRYLMALFISWLDVIKPPY